MMIIQVTKIKLLLMKNMRKKIIINLKFHRQIEMIKILNLIFFLNSFLNSKTHKLIPFTPEEINNAIYSIFEK